MNSNAKEIEKEESDGDENKNAKIDEKNSLKLPFDMRNFWKSINEKYFKMVNMSEINEVNHLVHQFSKYGIHYKYL
jgi:hypothetical protein